MTTEWLILANGTPEEAGLTAAGAAIMTVSVLLVLALNAFCMSRIVRESKPSERHHVPLDIDTGDRAT